MKGRGSYEQYKRLLDNHPKLSEAEVCKQLNIGPLQAAAFAGRRGAEAAGVKTEPEPRVKGKGKKKYKRMGGK